MDNSKKNATKKASKHELEMKQKFQGDAEEFSENYIEKNEEKKLIDFGNEVMKNKAQILLKKSVCFFQLLKN